MLHTWLVMSRYGVKNTSWIPRSSFWEAHRYSCPPIFSSELTELGMSSASAMDSSNRLALR